MLDASAQDGRPKPAYATSLLASVDMPLMVHDEYGVERIRRCVIQYSTADGVYPFCTINGGPTYRPFIEKMIAQRSTTSRMEHK